MKAARGQVALLLDAKPGELAVGNSATESNNLGNSWPGRLPPLRTLAGPRKMDATKAAILTLPVTSVSRGLDSDNERNVGKLAR